MFEKLLDSQSQLPDNIGQCAFGNIFIVDRNRNAPFEFRLMNQSGVAASLVMYIKIRAFFKALGLLASL